MLIKIKYPLTRRMYSESINKNINQINLVTKTQHPLADLFIPTPFVLLWEAFSNAAITVQRFFVHISTLVCTWVLIYSWVNCGNVGERERGRGRGGEGEGERERGRGGEGEGERERERGREGER